jgi:hypothetical protein
MRAIAAIRIFAVVEISAATLPPHPISRSRPWRLSGEARETTVVGFLLPWRREMAWTKGGNPPSMLGCGGLRGYWSGVGSRLEAFHPYAWWCLAMDLDEILAGQRIPRSFMSVRGWSDLLGRGWAWPPSMVCAWPCSWSPLGAVHTEWPAGLVRIMEVVLGFLSRRGPHLKKRFLSCQDEDP